MSDNFIEGNNAARRDPSATLTVALDSGARSGGITLALDSVWMERFLVRNVLGSGASAAVFEALDLQTQREVALKVLRSRHPNAVARLKTEFRTLAQIAHPNLVAMHALWVDEQSRGVISMDVVRGHSFLGYVRPEPIARRDDTRLRATLEQLVRGVQYLHAHGCLHRDLKPSNVLVSDAGQLTIVDFGLAQSTRDAAEATDTTFEGTPAYAAPEQLDSERVTEASDWYAVGGMLYEALCGQRPFTGKGADLLARKSTHDPPAPSLRTREPVPHDLERICMQLLARDPSERAQGDDVLAVLGADSHVPELGPAEVTTTLAGRDAELDALERWFTRVHNGRGGALAIVGDSGVGKTALSSAFLESLRTQGRARVLSGRCFVHEALAYNAFDEIVEALSHWLRQLPDAERTAILPVDFAALARLFPALRGSGLQEAALDAVTAPAGLGERARAFRALHQLFERMSLEQALVLHVDDLQWADADSQALLRELLIDPVPRLCLLVTVRHDAVQSEPVASLLAQYEQLALGPLSEHAVRALAASALQNCQEELLGSIARESAGHPLLAKELIAHARRSRMALTPGGAGLADALRERLSLLSPGARLALEVLCVAGQPLPRSCVLDLGASAGVDLAALRELRVTCALRETLREGVILVEPYHDSIRQLLAAELDSQRARELHLQLGQQLSQLGATSERYLELAVHHFVSGGEWRLAAHLAERAAARAAASLALNRAAELLELALRAVAPGEEHERLQLEAAEACVRAGRNLAAAQHYQQAAEHAKGPRRLELQLQALTAYYVSGNSTQGRALLEVLGKEAELSLDSPNIGAVRGVLELWVLMLTGLPYLRKPGGWLLPARSQERDAMALRVLWGAAATLMPIDVMASCQFASRALALAARTGDRAVYGKALALHVGLVPAFTNQRSKLVDRRLARARRLAQTSSEFWDDAYVRVGQGSAALVASDYLPALNAALEIAQIPQLRTPVSAHVRTSARIISLLALYWLGRITQMSELSQAWLEDALMCGDRMQEFAYRTMRCYGHLRVDQSDKAVHEIERASAVYFDFVSGFGSDPWWFAGVAQYRGEPELAAKMCRDSYVHFDIYARYCGSARAEWTLALGGAAAALAAHDIARDENIEKLRRQVREAKWCWGRIARPISAQLDAAHAALSGKPERAFIKLTRTVQRYEALGMSLHAASARLVLSRFPGRHAAALERLALNAFRAEGIARPEHWTRMLMPGFSI